jgi:hypothetical protein
MFPLPKLGGTHLVHVLWDYVPISNRNETLCRLHPGDEREELPGLFLADGSDDNNEMSDNDNTSDGDNDSEDL